MTATALNSAGSEEGARGSTQQLVTFLVDGLLFGIDVRHVQEVIQQQEVTRIPLAADIFQGLMNLRGQLVLALDVRRRLGLKPRESGSPPVNVVIRQAEGPLSLLVDEVGDIVEVTADEFEPPPETVAECVRRFLAAVYKLPGCLLLVLDPKIGDADVETSSRPGDSPALV